MLISRIYIPHRLIFPNFANLLWDELYMNTEDVYHNNTKGASLSELFRDLPIGCYSYVTNLYVVETTILMQYHHHTELDAKIEQWEHSLLRSEDG